MPETTTREDRFWVSPGGIYYRLHPDDTQEEWILAHQATLPLSPKYDKIRVDEGIVDEGSMQLVDDSSTQLIDDSIIPRDEEEPIITEEGLIQIGYAKISVHDKALFITTARGTSRSRLLEIIWRIANYTKIVDFAQVSVLFVGQDNFTRLSIFTNREWF